MRQHPAGPPATQDPSVPGATRPASTGSHRQSRVESGVHRGPQLGLVGGREDTDMDERVGQFFVIVAGLCGDARLGRLTLRLKLATGEEIAGVAEPVRETEGSDELGDIGYADAVMVDGIAVALSDVIEATIARPVGGRTPG
jgi:hypothetical protein